MNCDDRFLAVISKMNDFEILTHILTLSQFLSRQARFSFIARARVVFCARPEPPIAVTVYALITWLGRTQKSNRSSERVAL